MSPWVHIFEHLVEFEKVLEPLGGGVLLEEVCCWEQALGSYSLIPLAVLSSAS